MGEYGEGARMGRDLNVTDRDPRVSALVAARPRAAIEQKETTKMRLGPLNDRIVVRRMDAAERSPGGIVLPDVAKEKPTRGEVLAVGPGLLLDDGSRHPCEVRAGQIVIFKRLAGADVVFEGEKYTILRESEILAVVWQQ